jgi:hypothetical protein
MPSPKRSWNPRKPTPCAGVRAPDAKGLLLVRSTCGEIYHQIKAAMRYPEGNHWSLNSVLILVKTTRCTQEKKKKAQLPCYQCRGQEDHSLCNQPPWEEQLHIRRVPAFSSQATALASRLLWSTYEASKGLSLSLRRKVEHATDQIMYNKKSTHAYNKTQGSNLMFKEPSDQHNIWIKSILMDYSALLKTQL